MVLTLGETELLRMQVGMELSQKGALWGTLNTPPHEQDKVSLDHLKDGHAKYDKNCSTCRNNAMRNRPHVRGDGEAEEGELSGDVLGPLVVSYTGNLWVAAFILRKTRMSFVKILPTKESYELRVAVEDLGVDLMELHRYHSDGGKEMKGHLRQLLRKALVRMTDTGG